MIKEHDRMVLTRDVAAEGLKAGDIGTVVHIHNRGVAFEVEFMTLTGKTITVVTLLRSQLRPIGPRDMGHVRKLKVA